MEFHSVVDHLNTNHVETTYKATVIANIIRNKGGIVTSFNYFDQLFSFVCNHLASSPEELAERNSNYNIETTYKATGIANIIRNKGGLVTSFKYFDQLFSFVCLHLASSPKEILTTMT